MNTPTIAKLDTPSPGITERKDRFSSFLLALFATGMASLPEVYDEPTNEFSTIFTILLTVALLVSSFFTRHLFGFASTSRMNLIRIVALAVLSFVGKGPIVLGFRLALLLQVLAVIPFLSNRYRDHFRGLANAVSIVFLAYICVDLLLPLLQQSSIPRQILYGSTRISGLLTSLCYEDSLAVSVEGQTVLYRVGNELFHPRFFVSSLILFAFLAKRIPFAASMKASMVAAVVMMTASIVCATLRIHLEMYSHQRWTNASFFLQTIVGFTSWLLLISAYFPQVARLPVDSTEPLSKRQGRVFPLVVYLTSLLMFIAIFCPDPGVPKQKRIVVHEHNSNWEPAWQEYNKFWFGSRVDYNYSLLARLLSGQYAVSFNHDPISYELAANADIFLIKTPTKAFSAKEIEILTDFVRKGGGLVVFGDHTNVFGSSKYLNELLHHFDLRLRYDGQYDVEDGGLTLWVNDAFFPHPSVKNIQKFLFGTGATIASASCASSMIVGANFTQPLDYAIFNYFMKEGQQAQQIFGEFTLCSTSQHGQGRVCLFSDSTVLSNFWVFYPGKPEFVHGIFDWANRKNLVAFPTVFRMPILLGLLLLVSIACYRHDCIDVALAGLATSIAISAVTSYGFYPNTDTRDVSGKEVVFVDHAGDYFIAHSSLSPNPIDSPRYGAFFLTPARSGAVVRQVTEVKQAVARNPQLVVFLRPTKAINANERALLSRYVEQGGTVLVGLHSTASLDVAESVATLVEAKIERNKISINNQRRTKTAEFSTEGWKLGEELTVIGGQKGTLAQRVKKKGKIIIATGVDAFTDPKIGGENAVPSLDQLGFRVIAQWLFDSILEDKFADSIPFAEDFYDVSGL
jgi:hypothetical protein